MLYSLFLAAYSVILYRRTGEADLVVGSMLSGRSGAHDLRRTVGPLASQSHYRSSPAHHAKDHAKDPPPA